jgi:hypothetical protein
MIIILHDALSEQELRKFPKGVGSRDYAEPEISKLAGLVKEYADVSSMYPAYCVVEQNPNGHDWHTDTGNNQHMTWCTHTATMLLSDPSDFEGGEFFFYDDQPIKKSGDLLIYSSDVKHKVNPHTGDRRVLLMFFKEGR